MFKKYTGIFAISYDGVLGWELYDKGGIDSDRLYEFLEKHITTKFKNKLIHAKKTIFVIIVNLLNVKSVYMTQILKRIIMTCMIISLKISLKKKKIKRMEEEINTILFHLNQLHCILSPKVNHFLNIILFVDINSCIL